MRKVASCIARLDISPVYIVGLQDTGSDPVAWLRRPLRCSTAIAAVQAGGRIGLPVARRGRWLLPACVGRSLRPPREVGARLAATPRGSIERPTPERLRG